jgi:hypothetical protein
VAGTPFAITAARARRDMVDARGRGDMTGMLLPIEPTDSIDAAHPSEPMDRNEPVEQIDWNESLLRRTTWTGQPGSHAHPVKGTSLWSRALGRRGSQCWPCGCCGTLGPDALDASAQSGLP